MTIAIGNLHIENDFFFCKKSNIWYYTHLSTSEERPMVDVCKLRKIGKGLFYRDTFLPFFAFGLNDICMHIQNCR